jgi:hypothetical protein
MYSLPEKYLGIDWELLNYAARFATRLCRCAIATSACYKWRGVSYWLISALFFELKKAKGEILHSVITDDQWYKKRPTLRVSLFVF